MQLVPAIPSIHAIRAIVAAIILGATGAALIAQDLPIVDDGWRRTKNGWENIADWNLTPEQLQLFALQPASPAMRPLEPSPCGQVHPLAIACGLLLLGVAALRISAAWPPRS